MKVYYTGRDKNIYAEGFFDIESGELTVLKGARVSEFIAEYKSFKSSNKIKELRKILVKEGILSVDYTFGSPSTAANFVSGASCNGLLKWKDENGKKLKEIIKK